LKSGLWGVLGAGTEVEGGVTVTKEAIRCSRIWSLVIENWPGLAEGPATSLPETPEEEALRVKALGKNGEGPGEDLLCTWLSGAKRGAYWLLEKREGETEPVRAMFLDLFLLAGEAEPETEADLVFLVKDIVNFIFDIKLRFGKTK